MNKSQKIIEGLSKGFSPEAKKLNPKLEIKRIKNKSFGNSDVNGYAFFIKGKGYLSYNGKTPYMPIGGEKALKEIIDGGGFLNYKDMKFLNPDKD